MLYGQNIALQGYSNHFHIPYTNSNLSIYQFFTTSQLQFPKARTQLKYIFIIMPDGISQQPSASIFPSLPAKPRPKAKFVFPATNHTILSWIWIWLWLRIRIRIWIRIWFWIRIVYRIRIRIGLDYRSNCIQLITIDIN